MHAPSKSLESSLLEQGRRDREEVTEETKMETKMEAKDEVKLEAASSGFGRHELRGNPTKKDLQVHIFPPNIYVYNH